MSNQKILTVGMNVSADDIKFAGFDSKISLHDWDIIIFYPDISFYYELTDNTFNGKPALSETFFVSLKEQAEHWRREILNAFNSNKTIIVILNEVQEIYIDTGERKYTGEGTNRKATRLFDIYSNYDTIPLNLKPVNASGKTMRLARSSEIINGYWKEFSYLSEYKVIIEEKLTYPLLFTAEERIVGALAQNKLTNGAIVLLPYVKLNRSISTDQKFLKSIIEIDAALKVSPVVVDKISIPAPSTVEKTPEPSQVTMDESSIPTPSRVDRTSKRSQVTMDESSIPTPSRVDRTSKRSQVTMEKSSMPSSDLLDKSSMPSSDSLENLEWIDDDIYELPLELKFKKELLQVELKFEELMKEEEIIKSKIIQAGFYKRLLYEEGIHLKETISESLKLLGFETNDSEPNSHMVFESPEGKFFMEAEGTDNEAIGFDRLRQLELSILEDYAREDTDKIAKGILFANAYRMQELKNRDEFFSAKCTSAAKRSRIALVRTPDLFWVVKYLSDHTDMKYAKKCREVILKSEGEIAKFPEPPQIFNSLKNLGKE